MKHDEKKIEEIMEGKKDYLHNDEGLFTGEKTVRFIKQYAEHMIQQERERVVGLIEDCSDFADSGNTLKKRIINLINKE